MPTSFGQFNFQFFFDEILRLAWQTPISLLVTSVLGLVTSLFRIFLVALPNFDLPPQNLLGEMIQIPEFSIGEIILMFFPTCQVRGMGGHAGPEPQGELTRSPIASSPAL
jgi:hypothetical protein